uniref:Uncharacterized protein n=1 Tax=Mycolicibacterium neoaurum VKM Ac-1815D TaxID=700508 RepID=V5XIQ9_MYCNE
MYTHALCERLLAIPLLHTVLAQVMAHHLLQSPLHSKSYAARPLLVGLQTHK